MRRIPAVLVTVTLAVLLYLVAKPVPIDPAPWTPTPNAGFSGPFAPNSLLTTADSILLPGTGPEDLAVGPDGKLYTGLVDGRILRVDPATGASELVASTDGRPLGLRFDRGGSLIVADAVRGVLSVSMQGTVTVLTDSAAGQPLRFTDALDIAPDGTIWFSDASQRWDVRTGGIMDFWESRPSGRLLRYDPALRTTSIALDSIDFANGVAVGPEGAWVLVNETMAGRIRRLWLAGPLAGQAELFVEGLPGMPDNISYDGHGVFHVALFAPRTEETMRIRALAPFWRKVLYRIPERFRLSGAAPYGMIVAIDTLGAVQGTVQDPTGRFHATTGAVTRGDTLYVGSLLRNVIARLVLPAAPKDTSRGRPR